MKGVVKVIPVETFADPNFGASRGDRFERVMSIIEDRPMTSDEASGWFPLHTAIKRNAMFSIQAKTPSMDLELRFAPDAEGGSYTITTWPRGEIEKGRVQRVIAIPAETTDPRFTAAVNFKYRFVVGSSTDLHPFKRRAWIVGVDDPVLADGT